MRVREVALERDASLAAYFDSVFFSREFVERTLFLYGTPHSVFVVDGQHGLLNLVSRASLYIKMYRATTGYDCR